VAQVTSGAGALATERGLEAAAENRAIITTVRGALREEGVKVSGNMLVRGARIGAKAAVAAHVAIASSERESRDRRDVF
jgi:hypothetical protein